MPITAVATPVAVGIGRGLNAFSLRELVKRRVPGFDDSEYLSELNAAYQEVWEELMQIDELFFSDVQTVTVTVQGDTFDLVNNGYANLSAAIPRLHQIHSLRAMFPGSAGFYPAAPRHLNDDAWLATRARSPATVYSNGPCLYVPFGEGSIVFARPLPVGTQLEVFFTYGMIDMQIIGDGTVTSSGTAVTGTDTKFTRLVPPELAAVLPSTASPAESQVVAELMAGGLVYRVASVTSDTALATAVPITPALATSPWLLASVPEMPAYEHRVIAAVATRNVLSTPADDERFGVWAALAEQAKTRMKSTLQERQRQQNPKKKPFRRGGAGGGIDVVGPNTTYGGGFGGGGFGV